MNSATASALQSLRKILNIEFTKELQVRTVFYEIMFYSVLIIIMELQETPGCGQRFAHYLDAKQ